MWQVKAGQSLSHRGWDDEYVLYNDLSGDTHLFGPDAMRLLLCLRDGPAHEATLAEALEVAPEDREAFGVMLAELGALALIERS